MNQILALLEQDPSYCERFLKYASSRTECPFTVYTFQTVTELQRFAHQNDIDLLLSDAQTVGDAELEKLPVHTRVELTEEPMGEKQVLDGARPDAPRKIYKYQSGEKISPGLAPRSSGRARGSVGSMCRSRSLHLPESVLIHRRYISANTSPGSSS